MNDIYIKLLAAGATATGWLLYHKALCKISCKTTESSNERSHKPAAFIPDASLLCIRNSRTRMVTTAQQWEHVWGSIAEEVQASKIVGLDCEWKSYPNRCPVALLQLATVSGVIILIRLFLIDDIPDSLRHLLADRSVIKVGVQIQDDAKKLYSDYGLDTRGWVDLRHVAKRANVITTYQGYGLKGLSREVLGVELDKNEKSSRSNWEAEILSQSQVMYAAADAIVGVFIFLRLVRIKLCRRGGDSVLSPGEFHTAAMSMCQGLMELSVSNKQQHLNNNHTSSSSSSHSKPSTSSTLKPVSRSYIPRKAPLYQNCKLIAPDDQLLCTCDEKKARWYVEKGLADEIIADPLTVKLRFEPAGRPRSEKNYYCEEKLNICVVCGDDDSYIRKNIVPHEYRKYFPPVMKEHRSHDVLLVCMTCHQQSNHLDTTIKQQLADKCGAPMGTERGVKYHNDFHLAQVVSAAKALCNPKNRIPADRRSELAKVLQDYYGVTDIDAGLLQKALTLDTKVTNNHYVPHGRKVVEHMMETEGLVEFEKMWREHFLRTMKPQFMPSLWSVEHRHENLQDIDAEMKERVILDEEVVEVEDGGDGGYTAGAES